MHYPVRTCRSEALNATCLCVPPWDSTQPPPVNQNTIRVTPTSVSKGRAGRAMSHYQIGSRSLTIHCSRAFPSVIFKTCKASPMPHIKQDRNICLHS